MGNTPRTLLLVSAMLLGAPSSVDARPPDWAFDHPFLPQRGRIGVQVQPMTPELREHFKAPPDRGLLVARVEANRPADRAGLRVGDVIVSAAGRPMQHRLEQGSELRSGSPPAAAQLAYSSQR